MDVGAGATEGSGAWLLCRNNLSVSNAMQTESPNGIGETTCLWIQQSNLIRNEDEVGATPTAGSM